jgi:N utilization substance protein A
VAREPGYRSKIAVESHAQGVDPVGACVGPRGSRVRMVVSELRGEKIDIIPWNTEPARFIAKALSPARVREVFVDDDTKEATVVVPEDQLALAIGKEGLNARLAARLTGWKVDIQSDQEFAQAEAEAAFVGDEGAGGDFSGRCVAVLANGKRCPNTTLPGSRFCGIPAHQEMAQREAAGEEVRTIDTVRSEEPDETDTEVETEVAAEGDESGGPALRPEVEGEVDESGDAIGEPEVVAAAQEEPVSDTAPAVSNTLGEGESGMPDAGPEDDSATEEVLIGSDVIQDAPSEPIHETAPLLDEGDEPSAA